VNHTVRLGEKPPPVRKIKSSQPNGRWRLSHGAPELIGRSAAAQDPDLARRLWTASEQLTGVRSLV
jgi:hypothetical protein